MKAILLANGYGTRLGNLTKKTPKPMLKVGTQPVIEQIVDRLALHGITEVIVNLHYLPQVVIEGLQNRALYYYEPEQLGHKGTIYALKEWIKDNDFFVINADTMTNVNYTEMVSYHKPQAITVCMDEWRATGTWIYPKEYFDNPDLPVNPYRPTGLEWHDIGTKDRLRRAREFYAKQ